MVSVLDSGDILFLTAIGALANATSHVLLKSGPDRLNSLSAILEGRGFWHLVLLHGFHEGEKGLALTHGGHSYHFVITVDVEGDKFVGHDVSLDVNRSGSSPITAILNRFVVVAGPEEGHGAVGNEFSEHVERSEGALVKCDVPVLRSSALSVHPVRVGDDVTCSEDVLIARPQEWIARDTAILLHI